MSRHRSIPIKLAQIGSQPELVLDLQLTTTYLGLAPWTWEELSWIPDVLIEVSSLWVGEHSALSPAVDIVLQLLKFCLMSIQISRLFESPSSPIYYPHKVQLHQHSRTLALYLLNVIQHTLFRLFTLQQESVLRKLEQIQGSPHSFPFFNFIQLMLRVKKIVTTCVLVSLFLTVNLVPITLLRLEMKLCPCFWRFTVCPLLFINILIVF